jgi:hypothetical protein
MLRKLLVTAIVVVGVFAPTAIAAQPVKSPVPPSNLSFAAGDLCPFGVSLQTVETDQFSITYSDGVTRTHGRFIVSVTNTDTQATRYLNLSGAITFEFMGPIVRATTTGPTLAFFPTGAFGNGEPGSLIFTHGRTTEVDDFSGPTPLVDSFDILSGTSENLCETMA